MNKFVKEQLNKCRTQLPEWDDDTTEMIISNSHNIVNNSGNLHICIENYIISEPPSFTLSDTWNGGTTPPENHMIVKLVNKNGKMYKVSGVGMNTNIEWTGWLPEKGFKVLE